MKCHEACGITLLEVSVYETSLSLRYYLAEMSVDEMSRSLQYGFSGDVC